MMTPGQARAARAFLNWTQVEAARRAGLAKNTVAHFEKRGDGTRTASIVALEKAYTDGGIAFSDDGRSVTWVGNV